MNSITLTPVEMSLSLLNMLESKKLIQTLKPTQKILNLQPNSGNCVDLIYSSDIQFGSHKLICIGLNSSTVKLNSHPDNEEFILLNSTNLIFKPLYLIIGLLKHDEFQNKIYEKKLSAEDLIAIKLKFNDPVLSIFTMLKQTVHCEVTDTSDKQCPIFFVTEPSSLKQNFIDASHYKIIPIFSPS
ncbi:hypothetical protein KA977_05210 [Candidatus Dependentiae bacterium]|nr:hypothetical protein [Candidatus Dependentiae bacterium]